MKQKTEREPKVLNAITKVMLN